MNPNDEFAELQRRWRRSTPPGLDVDALRRLVDADTRRHVSVMVTVAVLNLVVLAWGLWRVLQDGSGIGWASFMFGVALSAVIWAVTLWLLRGQRAPRDESTAAYLDVAIRRSRANVIAAPIGIGLYVAGLGIALAMRTLLFGQDLGAELRSRSFLVMAGIVLPLYALLMGWAAVAHRRRLERLLALQKALTAP